MICLKAGTQYEYTSCDNPPRMAAFGWNELEACCRVVSGLPSPRKHSSCKCIDCSMLAWQARARHFSDIKPLHGFALPSTRIHTTSYTDRGNLQNVTFVTANRCSQYFEASRYFRVRSSSSLEGDLYLLCCSISSVEFCLVVLSVPCHNKGVLYFVHS